MAALRPGNESEVQPWVDFSSDPISQLASQNMPIILPWKNQYVRIGTCFQSNLMRSHDPWLKNNPFILSDFYLIPRVLRTEMGGDSTFTAVNTTRLCESGDHLSLGLGVGVGLPFLASVSVKGQYDEHVEKNSDSNKSSIRASVRAGTVQLQRNPRLSHEAMTLLKYEGGYEAFCEKYGDYFLAGYRLGGETGLFVSNSSFSDSKVETYSITTTVQILFLKFSTTWSKTLEAFSSGKFHKLVGYDTLGAKTWNCTTTGDGIEKVISEAESIVERSQNIWVRVLQLLKSRDLEDGQYLSNEECEFLANQGAVIELILLPMSILRDVARWTTEDNII